MYIMYLQNATYFVIMCTILIIFLETLKKKDGRQINFFDCNKNQLFLKEIYKV